MNSRLKVTIFEDENWNNFFPLTLTRPVWELRCGIYSLKEKIQKRLNLKDIGFNCRNIMAPLVKRNNPFSRVNEITSGRHIFINARVVFSHEASIIMEWREDTAFFCGDTLAAAAVDLGDTPPAEIYTPDNIIETLSYIPCKDVDWKTADYLWDLVDWTPAEIAADLSLTPSAPIKADSMPERGVFVTGEFGVFIGKGCDIRPGVVLDSTDGPIYIDHDTKILPNASIIGPVYIGNNSLVKAGAKIYPGTSIGPMCKIGGELEETIIQGYSNKQHEGFLGHSYIGSWCNFGAGTENSDLKNNYSNVKVQAGSRRVDSGKMFVGLFMGDHSKTGINTTFNTGTVVGAGVIVYGHSFQPRFIPSFHWCDSGVMKRAGFDNNIKTAETMMARRNMEMTQEEKDILQDVYDHSV
ncbi:hypothetical protein ISS30_06790 [bacterium]|nr:hypothetical protein [bacterium]